MTTWIILSNYRTHGLAEAVRMETDALRHRLGFSRATARRWALVNVRHNLTLAIDQGTL